MISKLIIISLQEKNLSPITPQKKNKMKERDKASLNIGLPSF